MNRNIKWYISIIISVIILIVYAGYFFTDMGRGLGDGMMRTDKPLRESEN